MNDMFLEDPVVELKEVIGSDIANSLIKKGWIYLHVCHVSEVDCGNTFSYFKYCLALTKSAKNALDNKSNESKAETPKPHLILEEDF